MASPTGLRAIFSRTPLAPARRAPARAAAALLAVAALVGCESNPTRPTLTEAQLHENRAVEETRARAGFRKGVADAADRLARECDEYAAGRRTRPPRLEILAISGGGDYGAFGAGFLVGWGGVTDPVMRRPDFDAVTGVSTGSLIAPFAYVGTDEALARIESFYRNPKKDWVKSRGLLFFLPSNPSFMTIAGLERDIRSAVDKPFVAALAAQRRAGKLLVVSATNLDLCAQKVWEVGDEAIAAEETGDPDRVVRILLASTAIPSVFPPVEMDGFLCADGGVTANVFLRLDPKAPDSLFRAWHERYPDRPFPQTRYWIIVNNWRRPPPKTVQTRWPSIIAPSMTTSVRSATLAEIRWLGSQADFVNAVYHTDIEVRVVAVPDDWRPPVEGDFQKQTMESLCDLGRKMGADPSSWQLLASPKTAVAEWGK